MRVCPQPDWCVPLDRLECRYILKISSPTLPDREFHHHRYLEKADPASKCSVAYTFEAVNRHNPDRLKAHAAQAMPLAFLAMHEEEDKQSGQQCVTNEADTTFNSLRGQVSLQI